MPLENQEGPAPRPEPETSAAAPTLAASVADAFAADSAEDEEELPLTITTPLERRRAFIVLFLSLMCLGMGQTVMFNVLPHIARDLLGLSELAFGAIISLSGVIWFFTSPFWGHKSDEWGRKPVILIGLVGFSASMGTFGLTLAVGLQGLLPLLALYPLMLITRAIYGTFGPGAHSAAQAYIVDRTSRSARTEAIAALGASFGIGTILGPTAGLLVEFGLLVPFYFLSVMAALSALAVWRFIPERTPPRERKERPPRLSMLDPRISAFVFYNMLLSMVQAIPTQTIAFYMADILGLGPEETILNVSVAIMGSAMAALFAQLVLVQRFHLSASMLMRLGLAFGLASYLLIAVSTTFAPLVMAFMLQGLGFGMARPGVSAASSLAVGRREQGGVAGVMGGTGALGFVLSPFVSMPLYQWMPQAPYLFGIGLLVMMIAMNFALRSFRSDTLVREDDSPDAGVGRG